MGMYTSIRGVVKVKPEYVIMAEKFANHWKDNNQEELEEEYSFVKEYFKTARSTWIPSANELQRPFEDEQEYFKQRVDNDVFYFSADLKDYYDNATKLSPIDSFLKNILEVIAEEIYLLETNYEEYSSVSQYGFSDDIINTIEVANVANKEIEEGYWGWGSSNEEEEESEESDIFKEYKLRNNLRVFR